MPKGYFQFSSLSAVVMNKVNICRSSTYNARVNERVEDGVYNAQQAFLRLKIKLNICLDQKVNIGIFMIDLSNAFDCIPHEILIAKLHAYGFSRDSVQFTYNYLKVETDG